MTLLLKQAPVIEETSSPPSPVMSYEEYLTWVDEDVHAEWVPTNNSNLGKVIIQMPPKLTHQRTGKFLTKLLDLFIQLFGLGEIIIAPFEMNLGQNEPSREPDILFVATANLHRLSEDRLDGPADLAIEIVSRSSVKRDRDEKFVEYQDAGIPEYWIIDPRPHKLRADFYQLDKKNVYRLVGTDEDERVESSVLTGFWLNPNWLWQAETISELTILAEIVGGFDELNRLMRAQK